MPETAIRWNLTDGIAHLQLCRTTKRNALRMADWEAFARALDEISTAEARALVVSSDERGIFCAGSDLSELASLAGRPEHRVPFAVAMDGVMRRLCEGRLVTIAAITGACHGAGVAIAMACNIRIAEPAAVFAIPPARFGISYPTGDISRLVDLVGSGHAARLLYCADTIDAQEACRIGLVEILAEDALTRARELASMAASNSADSIALLKHAMKRQGSSPSNDKQFIDGFASSDFRRFASRDR